MFPLPPPLALRAAVDDDAVFLATLYASTRDDLAQMPADPAFVAQLIRMQQQLQEQGYRSMFPQAACWVLESASAPAGRMVVDLSADRVQLVDLALLPAARGQGAGSAVLRALQDWAGARGLPLALSVSHGNPDAARLYARLGFAVIDSDLLQQRMRWAAPRPAAPAAAP